MSKNMQNLKILLARIYLQKPTAGLKTYWAQGAQVPQQFAALVVAGKNLPYMLWKGYLHVLNFLLKPTNQPTD